MEVVTKTFLLFFATALAELVGCYLPYLWFRKGGSWWLLPIAAASLAAFAWLLTLHPTASGRVYAAYGGVYVALAVLWLWLVDGIRPARTDLIGAVVTVTGMVIIMFGPRPADDIDSTTGPTDKEPTELLYSQLGPCRNSLSSKFVATAAR